MRGYLYDYDEASALTGYSPATISSYCDEGRLKRDRDFIVRSWRHGIYRRRRRYITEAGLINLLTSPWIAQAPRGER